MKNKVIAITILALVATIGGLGAYLAKTQSTLNFYRNENGDLNIKIDTIQADMTANIEQLKNDVVTDLGDCETGKVAKEQREQYMKNDANGKKMSDENYQSYGWLQFKVGTVKFYTKKLDGIDIGNLEALSVAMNYDKSRTLAKRMLFEMPSTASNWYTCDQRLNVQARVDIIKKVTKKI